MQENFKTNQWLFLPLSLRFFSFYQWARYSVESLVLLRKSFMLQLKPHIVRAKHEQDDAQSNSSSFWSVLLFGICWGRSRLAVSPEEVMPWMTSVWLKSVIRVVQQGMYTPSGGVVFRIKRYSHGLFLDTAALWSCTVFGTLSHWGS